MDFVWNIKQIFRCYLIPDHIWLKIKYKKVFGENLDLNNPQTFTEKLQWLKLYDRKPVYHKLVDKFEAKKIIGKIIGKEYIIDTLGVWDKYEDIDFNSLPDKFVLKFTHDSGSIRICTDKSNFDKKECAWRFANVFRNRDFYRKEYKEWAYKGVKRRIIAEPYIKDDKYQFLTNYQFYCFNGNAKCLLVLTNKLMPDFNGYFYDMSWNRLNRNLPNVIEKPRNFELMHTLAEKIAEYVDNPFVRIDFYYVKGSVYFGEVTFYPNGGFWKSNCDSLFGSWIDLSKGAVDKRNMNNA